MSTSRPGPARQALLRLYGRLGEAPGLAADERIAVWLRLHLLMQTYHTLFAKPCPPRLLHAFWQGDLHLLDARAPALRFTLEQIPLPRESPLLPDDLLEHFCTLYHSPVPDLGTLYLLTQSEQDIKRKGQVFTPEAAVEHAFTLLRQPPEGRILDHSCGAGGHLLAAYRLLRRRYEADRKGEPPEAIHQRMLQEHLFGLDSDPWAVAVTRSRLFLECPTGTCLRTNIHLANAYHIFAHDLSKQSYHTIIGNPPWGGRITSSDKSWLPRDFQSVGSVESAGNSFLYFLEASLRLLEKQGQFSLLLPAAFLNAPIYREQREWLLERAELDRIDYVPALFPRRYAPAVFLAGTRTDHPSSTHAIAINRGVANWSQWKRSDRDCPDPPTSYAPQLSFQQSQQTIFNIHYNPSLEPIFARMRENACYLQPDSTVSKSLSKSAATNSATNLAALDDSPSETLSAAPSVPTAPSAASVPSVVSTDTVWPVQFVLGIITGNNRAHVRKMPDHPDCEPLFAGQELEPFRLSTPACHIVYDKRLLQQAAPKALFKAPEKLLYRFINKEICAAIDRSGAYTLNNLNFILPTRLPVSLRFLAGLLNSKLLNTYYMYHFFTGKVCIGNLCALPLKRPTEEEAQEIERLVQQLEWRHDLDAVPLLCTLNNAVYRLYGITQKEQQQIEQTYEELRGFPFV